MKNKVTIIKGTLRYQDDQGNLHDFTDLGEALRFIAKCGGFYSCGEVDQLLMRDTATGVLKSLKITNGSVVIADASV